MESRKTREVIHCTYNHSLSSYCVCLSYGVFTRKLNHIASKFKRKNSNQDLANSKVWSVYV